jgi:methionyl-tRNA formyltransferase
MTKVVLAAYGVPGVLAIETLFGLGIEPSHIRVLTHERDARNAPLLDLIDASGIAWSSASAKSDDARRFVDDVRPDVFFSIHYRSIIPASILEIPPLGCVNLHPSLLPDYRGTFSVPWVIINGERETGFSWHYMVPEVDAGRIVLQERIAIRDDDTAFSLFHRQIVLGMRAFERVYRLVVDERFAGEEQRPGGSYFKREVPYGGRIDPGWPLDRIERFIRAMHFPPFTGAVVSHDGRDVEVKSIDEYRQLTGAA